MTRGDFENWDIIGVTPLTPDRAQELDGVDAAGEAQASFQESASRHILPNANPVALLVMKERGDERAYLTVPGMVTDEATVVPFSDDDYGKEGYDTRGAGEPSWKTIAVDTLPESITVTVNREQSAATWEVFLLLLQRQDFTGDTRVKLGRLDHAGRVFAVSGTQEVPVMPRMTDPPEPTPEGGYKSRAIRPEINMRKYAKRS